MNFELYSFILSNIFIRRCNVITRHEETGYLLIIEFVNLIYFSLDTYYWLLNI